MPTSFENATFATRAVHAEGEPCPLTGATVPPVYYATSYAFENVKDGAQKCQSTEYGHCYTRVSNPTVANFEAKIAALENGEAAVAFGSGVAAISGIMLHLLKAGDHAIVDTTSYSATHYLFETLLRKFGIETSFVNTSHLENIRQAIRPETRIIHVESPANPTLKLVDLKGVADIANAAQITTVIDSTFATPYIQRPLEMGIDIVVHSCTKYICGHGDGLGGVAVGTKEMMSALRDDALKNLGGILAPALAYNFMRGLKTLDVRMKVHCQNAMKVARFLESHPKIARVYYPGLASHPQHELATRQMKDFGGIVCCELCGGLEAGITLMESVKLCVLAVSLGHLETLVEHPASMTHWYVPREERLKGGITDGLVRISIGLEDADDIIADLKQALKKV